MREMMKEFEKKQAQKLIELENTFHSKIESMMVKVMNDFKHSMTQVMTSMTAQLERIQMRQLEKISQILPCHPNMELPINLAKEENG